jgi:hypothetical protein
LISIRTWKAKLKEWKFEKYLTGREKAGLVKRAEKHKREEGKETVFFHFDRQVNPATLENFKKRKRGKVLEVSSPICREYLQTLFDKLAANGKIEKPKKIFHTARQDPSPTTTAMVI